MKDAEEETLLEEVKHLSIADSSDTRRPSRRDRDTRNRRGNNRQKNNNASLVGSGMTNTNRITTSNVMKIVTGIATRPQTQQQQQQDLVTLNGSEYLLQTEANEQSAIKIASRKVFAQERQQDITSRSSLEVYKINKDMKILANKSATLPTRDIKLLRREVDSTDMDGSFHNRKESMTQLDTLERTTSAARDMDRERSTPKASSSSTNNSIDKIHQQRQEARINTAELKIKQKTPVIAESLPDEGGLISSSQDSHQINKLEREQISNSQKLIYLVLDVDCFLISFEDILWIQSNYLAYGFRCVIPFAVYRELDAQKVSADPLIASAANRATQLIIDCVKAREQWLLPQVAAESEKCNRQYNCGRPASINEDILSCALEIKHKNGFKNFCRNIILLTSHEVLRGKAFVESIFSERPMDFTSRWGHKLMVRSLLSGEVKTTYPIATCTSGKGVPYILLNDDLLRNGAMRRTRHSRLLLLICIGICLSALSKTLGISPSCFIKIEHGDTIIRSMQRHVLYYGKRTRNQIGNSQTSLVQGLKTSVPHHMNWNSTLSSKHTSQPQSVRRKMGIKTALRNKKRFQVPASNYQQSNQISNQDLSSVNSNVNSNVYNNVHSNNNNDNNNNDNNNNDSTSYLTKPLVIKSMSFLKKLDAYCKQFDGSGCKPATVTLDHALYNQPNHSITSSGGWCTKERLKAVPLSKWGGCKIGISDKTTGEVREITALDKEHYYHDKIQAAAREVSVALNKVRIKGFSERTQKGIVKDIQLWVDRIEGKVQLTIVCTAEKYRDCLPEIPILIRYLKSNSINLWHSVWLNFKQPLDDKDQGKRRNLKPDSFERVRAFFNQKQGTWTKCFGSDFIRETYGRRNITFYLHPIVDAPSFPECFARQLDFVDSCIPEGSRVCDLYCNFGRYFGISSIDKMNSLNLGYLGDLYSEDSILRTIRGLKLYWQKKIFYDKTTRSIEDAITLGNCMSGNDVLLMVVPLNGIDTVVKDRLIFVDTTSGEEQADKEDHSMNSISRIILISRRFDSTFENDLISLSHSKLWRITASKIFVSSSKRDRVETICILDRVRARSVLKNNNKSNK